MAIRFVLPSLTVDQILDRLADRYNMIEAVELIRGTI